MSDVTRSARAGEFATAGRAKAADNWDFIIAKHAEGVPASAIARMSGCRVESVREIIAISGQEQPARRTYKSPRLVAQTPPAPVEPKPPGKLSKRGMPPKIRRRVAAIARKHGVTVEALIAKHDRRGLSDARAEAWYVVRFFSDASLPMIGAWFDRDHSTILNGIRKHEERLLNEADLASGEALGMATEGRKAA